MCLHNVSSSNKQTINLKIEINYLKMEFLYCKMLHYDSINTMKHIQAYFWTINKINKKTLSIISSLHQYCSFLLYMCIYVFIRHIVSQDELPWWLRWQRICLQCRRPGFDSWVRKIPWRRKWLPTPVSCLENPMDRGAWRAAVHRVTGSGTTEHTVTHIHGSK